MKTVVRSAVVVTAALGVIGAATGPAVADANGSRTEVVKAHGKLRELTPGGPFGTARAVVLMKSRDSGTKVRLRVRGIDPAMAGRTFGAHLHTGPCVAGNGAAAGPHYNADVIAGRVPPRIDETTEVWLDFTVSRNGAGVATAVVPFTPLPGDRSIVIHQEPTDDHGTAGPRLACLPLSW